MENLRIATTEKARQEIRDRMDEMRKARYIKDKENKEYYEKQEENHREHHKSILRAVAAVLFVGAGIRYGKPIGEIGKKLLNQK